MKKGFYLTSYLIFIFMAGCASYRPVLYDNEVYQKAGEAQAERDIDQCMERADQYLKKHKNERMAKQAGRSAVAGGVVGAVLGGLSGAGVKGAAIGAGAGAAVGAGSAVVGEAAKDNLTPDQMKNQYVSRCLNEKGYEITGWK